MFVKISLRKLLSDSLLKKALAAIVILLLPIIVAFTLIYHSTQKHIKELAINDLTVMAEAYEGQVYQFLEMSYRRIQDFASDGYIKDQLQRIIQGDKAAVEPLSLHLAKNKITLDDTIQVIHITAPDGRVVASSDHLQIGKNLDKEIFSNKITDSTTKTDKDSVYGAAPGLYVQTAITDRATRKKIGFIVNVISLAEITKVLTGELNKQLGALSWRRGRHDTMEAYLVNKDGFMITESRTGKALLNQKADTLPVNQCLQSGKEIAGFYKNYRGVEVAGASMCLPTMQWVLLVEVVADELMSPVSKMQRDATMAGVLVTVIIIILFIIFMKGILLPLRNTADALSEAQRIARLGNWEWDIEHNKVNWSDEVYNILGLAPQESMAGYGAFISTIHPEDRELVSKSVDEALYEKKPFAVDHRIVLPDGTLRIVHEQGEVMFSSGRPVMMRGTVQDITKQKQAENEAMLLKTIAQSISECADIHTALSIVTQMLCEYEDWIFGEVWIPAPDGSHLICNTAWYTRRNELTSFRKESLGVKFERGIGLPGRAWESRKPVWVNDVTQDPNFLRTSIAIEVNIKAGVSIPIIANDAIIAVIVFFLPEAKELDSRAVELASSIATQLGLVIKRKHFEASRTRLAKILETTTDFVATFNSEGQILFYNNAARKMLGIAEHEDISAANIMDALPVFADTVMGAGLSSVISSGVWNGEATLISKSGKEIPVSVVILAHKDAAGAIEFFSVIARDISERKRSEQELKKLSMVIDQSVNIIFITDSEGRIEYVNQALEETTGWTKEELIGSNPRIFKSGETKNELYEDLWTNILAGNTWRGKLKNKTKYGATYWVSAVVSPIIDENNKITHFLAVQEDITEKRKTAEKIERLATHDELTGLFNRARFIQLMDEWIEVHADNNRAVFQLIDLDEFKFINDTYGHGLGDKLLCRMAETLQDVLTDASIKHDTAILGRMGGDEFALFLAGVSLHEGLSFANMIRSRLGELTFADTNVHPTVSIGMVSYPEHAAATKDLFTKADAAIYRAKELGRNRCHVYSPEDRYLENLHSRFMQKESINRAIENDRFLPWFQPILNLKEDKVNHYEALARMLDEDGKIIMPSGFIDTAERFGLIGSIDRIIIKKTMQLQAEMQRQGRHISFGMNLSGKDMGNKELLSYIHDMVSETGANPSCLIFEITETAAIHDLDLAINFINALKSIGCCFSLDDFGVGFTSFVYLREMHVDYIKIDGSFIKNLHLNPNDQLFVKAITDVAKGMGVKTVAEFVEKEETVGLLREYGVDYAQGYLIGKPRLELLK